MDAKTLIIIVLLLVVIGIVYISLTQSNTSTGQTTRKNIEVPSQAVDDCPCGCGESLYGPSACSCPDAIKARNG